MNPLDTLTGEQRKPAPKPRRCAVCLTRLAVVDRPPWAPDSALFGLCYGCAEDAPASAKAHLDRVLAAEAHGLVILKGRLPGGYAAEARPEHYAGRRAYA